MPSTVRERKEKQATEPLEDQYECMAEPASHVKNPDPAPALLHPAPSLSAVSCNTDRQTSGSEQAGNRGCARGGACVST